VPRSGFPRDRRTCGGSGRPLSPAVGSLLVPSGARRRAAKGRPPLETGDDNLPDVLSPSTGTQEEKPVLTLWAKLSSSPGTAGGSRAGTPVFPP